ncbi:hypothetical protein [Candidatus Ichthyocystis sparus]|nr:hypothetical protein [Candidatus Ichthyocystis sparus]
MSNGIVEFKCYNKLETSNSDEFQDESEKDIGNLSAVGMTTNAISSISRRTSSGLSYYTYNARSFYKNTLKTSIFLSILGQVTPYVLKPIDTINIERIKLLVKTANIRCLLEKAFNFGENNLILNGVDLRSELKQVNMTPEYIMSITNGWGKHYIDNYHNRTNMDNNSLIRKYISVISLDYSKIEKLILDASERIANITSFDTQSRQQIGRLTELVRLNNTAYQPCHSIVIKGYHEEQIYSLDTEWYIKVVIILMSFFALLYFFAMIFRRTKGCRGMRRLFNNMRSRATRSTLTLLGTAREHLCKRGNTHYVPLNEINTDPENSFDEEPFFQDLP